MNKNNYLTPLLFACIILSPGLGLIPGLPVFRAEDFIILILMAKVFFGKTRSPFFQKDKNTTLFFFMMLMAMISISLPSIVFGNDVIFNDFMILFMLLKYWMIYIVARSINGEKTFQLCLLFFICATIVTVTIGICQHYNLFGVNHWLSPHYINRDQALQSLIQGYYKSRIGGTHGDPRRFAYMLVVFMGAYMALFITLKSRKIKIGILSMILMALMALIFTLSRSGIFALIGCVFGVLFILSKIKPYKNKIIPYVLLGGIFFAGAFSFLSTEGFEERVLETDTVSYKSSMHARIRDFWMPLDDAVEHPLIFFVGRGPAKDVMKASSHNDWGWFFHRFGLPGLGFYIILIVQGLKSAAKSMRTANSELARIYSISAFFCLFTWLFYANAEDIFKDPQIMALNMFFLGIANNNYLLALNKQPLSFNDKKDLRRFNASYRPVYQKGFK